MADDQRSARGRAIHAGSAALLCGLLPLALTACAHNPPSLYGKPGTSAAPHIPWVPPPEAKRQPASAAPAVTIPPDLVESAGNLSLAQIVDIALRTSSDTRAAWAAARSAAAAYGSKRGDYLPDVNLGASVIRQKGAATAERPASEQQTYGPSADFTYLLFNFGGRNAAVEETRQALVAADWSHNAAIQDVILRVEEAYYTYVTAQALLAAGQSTLEEAQTNLDSAEERHRAGLATIADVLQARTALSQVRLALETLKGQIATTRGALATAMGLPANTPFDVESLPGELPTKQTTEDVERYLDRAKAERPDLAAARALALKAAAHVRKVKADGYPSLTALGNAGRVYRDNPDRFSDTYLAGLQLRFPFFTGFSHHYDVLQSEADLASARAHAQSLEQTVVLQVWTSYYNFKTAEQRLTTSEDLLRSATESHDVALGRYREGVGTVLDLLAAQAALEQARAERVLARSDWFLSLAQLAHDTGTLAFSPSREAGDDDSRKGRKP